MNSKAVIRNSPTVSQVPKPVPMCIIAVLSGEGMLKRRVVLSSNNDVMKHVDEGVTHTELLSGI